MFQSSQGRQDLPAENWVSLRRGLQHAESTSRDCTNSPGRRQLVPPRALGLEVDEVRMPLASVGGTAVALPGGARSVHHREGP